MKQFHGIGILLFGMCQAAQADTIYTQLLGINNNGQIIGYVAGGASGGHDFIYNYPSGPIQYLNPGGNGTQASAGINDLGQVAGSAAIDAHGFLFNGSTYSYFDAGSLGTYPGGINNAGQISGTLFANGFNGGIAFLDNGGVVTTLGRTATSRGYGINNLGQVAGIDGGGFIYSAGVYTDINVPGSNGSTIPTSINDLGQVVGRYADSSESIESFIFSGGVYTSFQAPGGFETEATGINNAGQIVGWYADNVGVKGFVYAGGVFTTVTVTEPATPEPGSWTLLATGGVALLLGRKWTSHKASQAQRPFRS